MTMPAAIAKLQEALELLEVAARDDRETIGELAGAANRIDQELGEVRDGLLSLSDRIDSLSRVLDARTEQAA
jgi:hypothetical protein